MKLKRYYGCVITEGAEDGVLQILVIGPESIKPEAAWTWAENWVKRHQPEGPLRLTVWSEATLAKSLLG